MTPPRAPPRIPSVKPSGAGRGSVDHGHGPVLPRASGRVLPRPVRHSGNHIPHHRTQPRDYSRQLPLHVLGQYPHDAMPEAPEPFVPPRIQPPPLRVVPAINLHDEAERGRAEVRDVLADYDLPPEDNTELAAAKRLPESRLRRRGDVTHPSRTLGELRNAVLGETVSWTWQASLLGPAAGRTQPTRRRLHDARIAVSSAQRRRAAGNVRQPARPARCRAERSAPSATFVQYPPARYAAHVDSGGR